MQGRPHSHSFTTRCLVPSLNCFTEALWCAAACPKDCVTQLCWTAHEPKSASQQGVVVCWVAGRQQLPWHTCAWPPTQRAAQQPGRAMRSCLSAGKPQDAVLPVLRQAVPLALLPRHHAGATSMPPFGSLSRGAHSRLSRRAPLELGCSVSAQTEDVQPCRAAMWMGRLYPMASCMHSLVVCSA